MEGLKQAAKAVIAAKEAAENDECYSLNVGLHHARIENAFKALKKQVED
jgi:hypothetical protein